MSIQFNLGQFNSAIATAFNATAKAYAEQCQVELETPDWEWSSKLTRRHDGKIAGSPRDAIDTKDLLNSQQPVEISQANGRVIADIEYTSEHAAVVYEGWVDQSVYPGRPWGDAALKNLDVAEKFSTELKKELGL